MTEPWKIVPTGAEGLPRAPKEGRIMGAAVCEAGHVVLVVGNFSDRPVVEVHLDDDNVDQVIAMLKAAQRSRRH